LTGDQYDELVALAKHGAEGPDAHEWNTGIAP
jgi:hypothetical protein